MRVENTPALGALYNCVHTVRPTPQHCELPLADLPNDSHPYASLTPDAVLDAIESQGYWSDQRIYPLNSYENRVYQVGIEDSQPIIAKFYRPNRWNREQIQEEHDFTLELTAQELPVVTPLLNEQGETLRHFQANGASHGFDFALYTRKGGRAPELDNLDHLEVIGRLMGRMHNIGASKPFIHRPAVTLQSYAIDSADFLLGSDFLPAGLRDSYQSLSEDLITQLKQHFAATPTKQIRLHGDCHVGNMLWRDDAPNFVDFDDARTGPAIQDLWMLLSGDRQQQVMQIETILEAYEEFYEFDPKELKLIEPLRTLRLMHYAAWLARRWSDPAFPHTFTWFNTERYWGEHILSLREQLSALQEEPLKLSSFF